MARLSNSIEEYILDLLEEADGHLEFQRNLLAEHFSCAPSQINYVLTTRFTPYKGYFVESRRGGGGFVRILRVEMEKDEDLLLMIFEEIGEEITASRTRELLRGLGNTGKITKREEAIIHGATSDRALHQVEEGKKNRLRAAILKNILLMIWNREDSYDL